MKKFFLLFALCAFAFAACEKTSVEAPKGKLTLTSKSVMNFEAAGGAGEITYALLLTLRQLTTQKLQHRKRL